MSEKRYQVFISSTYSDLQEERGVLTQALPVLGCLPCGLDINPAAPGAWAIIKKLIDESDYYLLLLGSRYGTLSPSGISYVHMEYVYASTKQKPILILMHDSPESRDSAFQEKNADGRRQFNNFRNLLQKGLVTSWTDNWSLDAAIRNALPQLIEQRPSSGWIKAGAAGNQEQTREIENLRQRVRDLETEREQLLTQQSANAGQLAQGQDLIEVTYRCKAYAGGNLEEVSARTEISWNTLFLSFAPSLSQPQHEDFIAARIAERIQEGALKEVQTSRPKTHAVTDITIAPLAFNTIKIQFRTLGLIRRVPRDDNRTWWQLTASGEQQLNQLLSVRRRPTPRPA